MTENETPKRRIPGLLVAVLVSALVATVFGFGAGFVAADAYGGGTMLRSIAPALRDALGIDDRVAEKKQADDARAAALMDAARSEESRRIDVVDRAVPAVVSIVAEKDVPVLEQYDANPFAGIFGNIPGFNVPQYRDNGTTEHREVGAGTGFFVSEDGLIVTNKHVVADEAADYTVITSDGERHTATVLGRDPSNDLAVLSIDGNGYPFLDLSGDEPKVGQSVIAVGYALGQFSNSVSTGIVSGLSRSIRASDPNGQNAEDLYDVIQTDAAINPGNSGGPLLDIDGKAIGVNVAVVQGSQSIGFALPSTDVLQVVDSVKRTGRISRPFIGVRYVIIDADLAKKNQLPYDYGALVVRGQSQTDLAVVPGSPADVAGITENDIILEVEGKKITSDQPLAVLIRKYEVGDTVKMKVFHKGDEKDVELKLVERK